MVIWILNSGGKFGKVMPNFTISLSHIFLLKLLRGDSVFMIGSPEHPKMKKPFYPVPHIYDRSVFHSVVDPESPKKRWIISCFKRNCGVCSLWFYLSSSVNMWAMRSCWSVNESAENFIENQLPGSYSPGHFNTLPLIYEGAIGQPKLTKSSLWTPVYASFLCFNPELL